MILFNFLCVLCRLRKRELIALLIVDLLYVCVLAYLFSSRHLAKGGMS